MKSSRWIWIAVLILIAWLVLTWFLGTWIGVTPPALYYLRGGLWLIGIAGLVGYLVLRPKESGPSGQAGGAETEIEFAFAEASKRMQAARGVRQLASLPAVFLLGDPGSAKTSVVAKCGLEPELLAGQAYEEYTIAPTRALNLWFAHGTLFIDPAGSVVADAGARRKLFKKFLPVRVSAVLAAKIPPARAVVLTVDCDAFLQAGGADALAAKARQFHSILNELSRELGSSFPVYVLFTKADKIPYFRDFAETLTEAEAAEIFGVTLPMDRHSANGVYAEQETRRLTDAFQQLYYSLSDKRPAHLAREHDSSKLPNIYEFPREFGKLRSLLVLFLVDVCRPSQLGTSPFLRGFYFTGVRPVAVADVAPAQQAPVIAEQAFDAGATRLFNPRSPSVPLVEARPREAGMRRVPQWVFLPHLFGDVILADRPATTITQRNVKINMTRRVLLVIASAIALFFAAWWTLSYLNNRALVNDATAAARDVSAAPLPAGQLAPTDALLRLTHVKDLLVKLNEYHSNGAPFSYGGFLYTGDSIRQPLQQIYYALFRKLLLAPTQQTLAAICQNPQTSAGQNYRYVYDSLKAYLITTDHHEKSTTEFLAPVLLMHWQQNQQASAEQQRLAKQNFEFYAAQLAAQNPYPSYAKPDDTAVANARAYLKQFGQEETIYQAMLDAAGKGQKAIVFNDDYPGSRATVVNGFRVEPYYTQAGYTNFQQQLKNPDKYFSGETWVLGEAVGSAPDTAKLAAGFSARYKRDMISTWQKYLNAASVVPYRSIPDAVAKLHEMVGLESPLLRVLCVASENTKDFPQAFQPVQFVTPPGCSTRLVGEHNEPYMNSLMQLMAALQAVGPIQNADPNNVNTAKKAAADADNGVTALSYKFVADPADPSSTVVPKTTQILREPITRVNPLFAGAGTGPVNQAAAGMCAQIAPILNKYPFNPKAHEDVSLAELNQFLKPQDGAVWQLYNGPLKPLLAPAGNGSYAPAPGQEVKVTPAFLRFFNRAMQMSDALYKSGTQGPNVTFSMQPVPTPGLDHVTLVIDGTTLSTDVQSNAASQTFTWPGSNPGVQLQLRFSGSSDTELSMPTGLWAIWHVIDHAERYQAVGSQYELELAQRTSAFGIDKIAGHEAIVNFMLNPQGSPVFRPGYFAGLACVAKAAE